LSLDGWVRNRRDGSVELLAAGPAPTLDRLVEACRRGPAAALVTEVDRLAADEDPPPGFSERPSY
jgi:acylphosphatase